MKTVGISEFKTKCISLAKEVGRGREELVVTLRGKPLIKVVAPDEGRGRRLGGQTGACVPEAGDWKALVESDFEEDWE
jgi:antitoxin (DNA-binding transcriptional repressor) of toxin-antitoxin stability system